MNAQDETGRASGSRLKFLRLQKARARLALSGALLSALFLGVLALGTRTVIRGMAFKDIDEELYTLAVALGSSFELEGLEESKRDTLKADSTGLRFAVTEAFRMPVTVRIGTTAGDVVSSTWIRNRDDTIVVNGVSSAPTMKM